MSSLVYKDFNHHRCLFACTTNKTNMSICNMFLVMIFLSFLADLQVSGCDENCQEKPIFTPSKVVVKYGDPVNATCTICRNCTSHTLDLENNVGKKVPNGSEISWIVDKISEWRTNPTCHYYSNNVYCCKDLDVIVYQPPQNVSISFNHTGPIKKDGLYTLRCDVMNVAPVENLIVTFYKGQTALVHLKSTDNTTEPVNADFTLKFNFTKADNGAEFWCEAKLEMGPEGPQPSPVVKSGKLTATVHCADLHSSTCSGTEEQHSHATSIFNQQVHKFVMCFMLVKFIMFDVLLQNHIL